MERRDFELLVRDAEAMARYAALSGKLPPGGKVFTVIAALRAATGPPDPVLLGQLYNEIDALARAIAPMTVKQLRRRGSFIWHARHATASIAPFALGLVTLLLTLYLAFQSSQLSQAGVAIREYQEWADKQPKEKLYAAWKMYRYERVLNVEAPPLAQLDAYQKLVEDARQLVDKGAAIQTLLQDSAAVLYFPRFFENVGPDGFQTFISKLNRGQTWADNVQRTLPPQPSEVDTGKPQSGTSAGGSETLEPQRLDCRVEANPLKPRTMSGPPMRQAADVEAYSNSFDCFLSRLHISEVAMSYSPWPVIYQTKAKISLLVTWLLPGLYGLLGTCVFLLRDFVLLGDGRFSRDTRILSVLLLVLRIALGGLAGIIIGWFWVPTPVSNENAVLSISSIPFGLAFMAGFSIETLFSLLDRANKTIEGREPAKITEGKTGSTT